MISRVPKFYKVALITAQSSIAQSVLAILAFWVDGYSLWYLVNLAAAACFLGAAISENLNAPFYTKIEEAINRVDLISEAERIVKNGD